MKFLCPSCKAKYQIADEKVSGKTLKMVCRQCGDEIVIRGDGARRTPVPPTGVHEGTGGLSAGFQQHVTGSHAAMPEVADFWHVAINDIPVGPMRRDEVGRKMAVGAVGLDSLAWREGLDDWLPVKQIPELMTLWQTAHSAGLPVPQAAAAGAMASGGGVGPADRATMAPVGTATQVPAQVPAMELIDGHGSSPGQNISGPLPTLSSVPPPPSDTSSNSNSQMTQLPRFAENESGGKQSLGWQPMFALVCGGAFILAVGALLGAKMLAPTPQQTVAVPVPPPAAPAVEAPVKPEPKVEEPADEAGDEEELIVLEPEDIAGEPTTAPRKSAGNAKSSSGRTGGGGKNANLTAEQREMLERMGGSNFGDPSALKRPTSSALGGRGGNSGQSLTAAQLASVVNKGKRSLQRCYETALRGSGSTDTVRLDVEITVSPNGNVTSVKTKGQSLPGMDKCISSTARTWRFPKAGASTTTQFPILFQPGS